MTNKDGAGNAALAFQLLRQYISAPLAAQTLSGTLKGVFRMASNVTNIGVAAPAFRIAKCSADGSTVTEIKAVTESTLASSNAPPGTTGTTLQNRRLEQPPSDTFTITFSDMSISAGERLLIELGYRDNTTNTGRFGIINFGDNSGTDLPEDETTTTADNPWVEFSANISFAASGISGDLAATDEQDVAAAAGSVLVSGSLAATEAQDTCAIAGEVDIHGDLAATDEQDTAAASGTVLVSGSLAATDEQDVAAVAGSVLVSGSMAATDEQDTAAVSGSVLVSGSLAATDEQDVAAATGTVEQLPGPVTGDLAATEAQDVAAVAGSVLVSGSLAATETQDTAAATGTVEQPPGPIAGDLAATEAQDVAAVSGSVLVSGSLAATDNQDIAAIVGTLATVSGSLAATEAQDTCEILGTLAACIPKTLSMTDPDLDGLLAAAFLDRHERFAKRDEDVAKVWLIYGSAYCPPYVEFTWAQFRALPSATRTDIRNAGSGAGWVVTEGKSNA